MEKKTFISIVGIIVMIVMPLGGALVNTIISLDRSIDRLNVTVGVLSEIVDRVDKNGATLTEMINELRLDVVELNTRVGNLEAKSGK
jgi:uncharacterized protein YoxC